MQLNNDSEFLQDMRALEKARELVTELRRGHAMQNLYAYSLMDRVDDQLGEEQKRVGTAYFSEMRKQREEEAKACQ